MGGTAVGTATARELTLEDYEAFPEDGRRHEIVDGVEVVTAQPALRHQRVLRRLFLLVNAAVEAQADGGEAFFAPAGVILSPRDVVEPDLLYVSGARREILDRYVHGAPDLVVEVLSPSSRRTDEKLKKGRYELFGVVELWIADPEIDVVRVYRRDGGEAGGFGRPTELSAERDDILTTPLLPALSVRVASLFVE